MTHSAPARTVIVTGGRAPAALDWVRAFGRAGWRVVVAESEPKPLAAASRWCSRLVRVPPPRQAPTAFIQALADLAGAERAEIVLPTCEEVFTVSWGRDALAAPGSASGAGSGVRVLAPPLGTLRRLHDKAAFADLAQSLGLDVPETVHASSPQALADAVGALRERGEQVVIKPAFSRFGADVTLDASPVDALRTDTSAARPWLAQAFVPGRALCSFAIAHRGRLTAHSAYRTPFTAGAGAGVAFEPVHSPAARAFAEQIAAATDATGQLSFDFQQRADGSLAAVECNPRATSGIHLFGAGDDLVGALLGTADGVVEPSAQEPVALRLALALVGWRRGETAAWRRWLRTARDPVATPDDPAPGRRQVASTARLLARAVRLGVSPLAASTHDIEWNGDDLGVCDVGAAVGTNAPHPRTLPEGEGA